MNLPVQKFSTLVESMAAGVQGGAAQLVDLSVGSVLRALLEACAAAALWLQWLVLQVLSMTRAATSNGGDLDSWMADFGLARLSGSASVGALTFSRYTAGIAATVPVGTTVTTADGTQSFAVVQDATDPAWNGQGYTVPPLSASITVPAQATLPGSAGDVQPGAISVLSSALPGIDSVVNSAAFLSGLDRESDIALRARFQIYINSRSLATKGAIAFAVSSLRQGLRFVVLENQDMLGNPLLGHFWVVVDDGSGFLPSALLAEVSAAVEAVRPIGATYAVTAPSPQGVAIQLVVATSNAQTKPAVLASVQAAITQWVSALPIAATLAVSKLEAIAHGVDASVVSVTSATINGATADVRASASGVLVLTSVSVS